MSDNNERYCAKELVLLPDPAPEHRHPERNGVRRVKLFRCRKGSVDLFVEGPESGGSRLRCLKARFPDIRSSTHSFGNLWTVVCDYPNTNINKADLKAQLSRTFLSSDDASDIFTDPNIRRVEP